MPFQPLSEEVLTEILTAFAKAQSRPSEAAISELAGLTGLAEEAVRNRYRTAHQAAGGDSDPFIVSPFGVTDQ